jgi:hypothetical protein
MIYANIPNIKKPMIALDDDVIMFVCVGLKRHLCLRHVLRENKAFFFVKKPAEIIDSGKGKKEKKSDNFRL